jgi:hypothetical protein
MSDEKKSHGDQLRERLFGYYELLKFTTDLRAIQVIWELIGEIERRLRELEELRLHGGGSRARRSGIGDARQSTHCTLLLRSLPRLRAGLARACEKADGDRLCPILGGSGSSPDVSEPAA